MTVQFIVFSKAQFTVCFISKCISSGKKHPLAFYSTIYKRNILILTPLQWQWPLCPLYFINYWQSIRKIPIVQQLIGPFGHFSTALKSSLVLDKVFLGISGSKILRVWTSLCSLFFFLNTVFWGQGLIKN